MARAQLEKKRAVDSKMCSQLHAAREDQDCGDH